MITSDDALILIVDDTPKNLQVLGSILKNEGYKVAAAQDGQQALDYIKKKLPDLILLDVMMPEIDGFEVCKRLKECDFSRSIPVIFITALSDTEAKVKAFSTGGIDYIPKPFAKEEVLARVKVHVENALLTKDIKKANVHLTELNELKNTFIGMAAHDLRNPLSAIKGFSELLILDKTGSFNEQHIKFLKIINQSGTHMLNLINDLLDISMIESGNLELNLKKESLKELIKESISMIIDIASRKDITIESSLNTINDIFVDKNRICQVFDNLISNAIKYSKKGSTILVSLKEDNKFAIFSVKDQGYGIPKDELPKLFVEFQRLSPKPTDGEKSTGLGLSIAKKIASAHNAEITVESKINEGSTFTLKLPLKQ